MKKAVEAYWAGKISADDLTKAAAEVKKTSWTSVKSKGVDYIPRWVSAKLIIGFDDQLYMSSAVNFLSTIMSSIIQQLSMLFLSAILDLGSHPSMFTSRWVVVVNHRV